MYQFKTLTQKYFNINPIKNYKKYYVPEYNNKTIYQNKSDLGWSSVRTRKPGLGLLLTNNININQTHNIVPKILTPKIHSRLFCSLDKHNPNPLSHKNDDTENCSENIFTVSVIGGGIIGASYGIHESLPLIEVLKYNPIIVDYISCAVIISGIASLIAIPGMMIGLTIWMAFNPSTRCAVLIPVAVVAAVTAALLVFV